jgi:hypothetical protein
MERGRYEVLVYHKRDIKVYDNLSENKEFIFCGSAVLNLKKEIDEICFCIYMILE